MKVIMIVLIFIFSQGALADCEAPWGAYLQAGHHIFAYSKEHVSAGEQCEDFQQIRECNGATLSGDEVYQYEMCDSLKSCTDNQFGEIKDGESITFYKEERAPAGIQCQSQARTCNSGTLTGTYKHTSCR